MRRGDLNVNMNESILRLQGAASESDGKLKVWLIIWNIYVSDLSVLNLWLVMIEYELETCLTQTWLTNLILLTVCSINSRNQWKIMRAVLCFSHRIQAISIRRCVSRIEQKICVPQKNSKSHSWRDYRSQNVSRNYQVCISTNECLNLCVIHWKTVFIWWDK